MHKSMILTSALLRLFDAMDSWSDTYANNARAFVNGYDAYRTIDCGIPSIWD